MKIIISKTSVLLITILLTIKSLALLSQNDCIAIYRCNSELTGVSDSKVGNNFQLLWSFNTGDMIKSSPVVCNDKIYIGSNSGKMFCIDIDGKLLWEFTCETSVEAPPLLAGGNVFFGSLDGDFFFTKC